MRRFIYALYYIWNIEDDDDAIIIGVYSTKRKARKAKIRAEENDFRNSERGYFEIYEDKIDRSGWLEGFISYEEALQEYNDPSRSLSPLFPELLDVSRYGQKVINIKGIYALSHTHVYWEDGSVDEKIFGLYSSKERALLIKEHAKTQPGFCDHLDGFCIKYYRFNKDYFLPLNENIQMRKILENGESVLCCAAQTSR